MALLIDAGDALGRPQAAGLVQAALHQADLVGEHGQAGAGGGGPVGPLQQGGVQGLVAGVVADQGAPRRVGQEHVVGAAGQPGVVGDVGLHQLGPAGEAGRGQVGPAVLQHGPVPVDPDGQPGRPGQEPLHQ
jgi:hypothetical protein